MIVCGSGGTQRVGYSCIFFFWPEWLDPGKGPQDLLEAAFKEMYQTPSTSFYWFLANNMAHAWHHSQLHFEVFPAPSARNKSRYFCRTLLGRGWPSGPQGKPSDFGPASSTSKAHPNSGAQTAPLRPAGRPLPSH